jgi:hypothetical protein
MNMWQFGSQLFFWYVGVNVMISIFANTQQTHTYVVVY